MKTYEQRLKEFVFDVVGDMVDPSNTRIAPDRRTGGWRVIVLNPGNVPPEMIRDEWDAQTRGTEFENVPLFI